MQWIDYVYALIADNFNLVMYYPAVVRDLDLWLKKNGSKYDNIHAKK